MRITFIILSIILLQFQLNAQTTQSKNSETEKAYSVAFLIMDGVYNTELTAPYDIFQHTIFRKGIRPMEVFTIADKSEYITTFEGLKIIPDYN